MTTISKRKLFLQLKLLGH